MLAPCLRLCWRWNVGELLMLDVFSLRICGYAVYSWSGRMQNPLLNILRGLVNVASLMNALDVRFKGLGGNFVKVARLSHGLGHQSELL
ncbi:hypothetical protein AOQ84DRAFT_150410 [Glonium stellatum]|uniref:Uncharacterized protein n=1 Tax=Glonium stellatum TaxID=574774 RepID=A0A8E2F913_9PEZI|nr:hypothetical protein AOQ84DRAFT_150410 [Glonium stellatum]